MESSVSKSNSVAIAVLRAEVHELRQDLKELKESNKRLEEFMYKFEGGRAWLFGLIAIAATLGGVISSVIKASIPHGS